MASLRSPNPLQAASHARSSKHLAAVVLTHSNVCEDLVVGSWHASLYFIFNGKMALLSGNGPFHRTGSPACFLPHQRDITPAAGKYHLEFSWRCLQRIRITVFGYGDCRIYTATGAAYHYTGNVPLACGNTCSSFEPEASTTDKARSPERSDPYPTYHFRSSRIYGDRGRLKGNLRLLDWEFTSTAKCTLIDAFHTLRFGEKKDLWILD